MKAEMEQVYDTLTGDYLPECAVKEVENLFADDTVCDSLYAEVYDAKQRINQRLGTQEDKDLELIIGNLLHISRAIGYKMYEYGIKQKDRT